MKELMIQCLFAIYAIGQPAPLAEPLAHVCGSVAHPRLVVVVPESAETRKLGEVWESILARDHLTVPTGGRDVIDGREVIWDGTVEVRKGEPGYTWGVYDALNTDYGYRVELLD